MINVKKQELIHFPRNCCARSKIYELNEIKGINTYVPTKTDKLRNFNHFLLC